MKAHGRSLLSWTLAALAALAFATPAPAAADDDAAATSDDSLKASTAPPWNPPGAINARRPWEQVVLFPGRVVSLPLVGLGFLTDAAMLNLERTDLLTKISFTAKQFSERSGISVRPAHIETRTGVGGALVVGTPFLGGAVRNRLRAETDITLREYHQTTLSMLGRPARLDYSYAWSPEERFYGVGFGTPEDNASAYAWQTEAVRGSFRWAWNRDDENSPPRTELNGWIGPRTAVTRTGRDQRVLSWDERYPEIAAPTLNRRVEHLIYGASFQTDWRTGVHRWTEGWRVKVSGERYDRPQPLTALKIGRPTGAQFSRFVAETEAGFSFMRDPRTVRFLVRVVDQGVTSGEERFLVADMATLGGSAGLAGYDLGRFHDLDLLLMKVTYIFPLVRRLELETHGEWGSVYHDVWGDARPGTLRNSFGFALRGRLDQQSFGAVGMDFSRETARVRVTLGRVE